MKKILLIPMLCFAFFTGCTSDDETTKPSNNEEIKTVTLDASSYSDWVYFDFDNAEEAEISDPLNSDAWDIAFQRTKIKLNGGLSGVKENSAMIFGVEEFENVTTVPSNYYTFDDNIYFAMAPTEPYTGNKALEDWYTMQGMPPTLSSKGNIYIIKRKDKDYVKLKIESYYHPESNSSANYTIRYQTGIETDNSTKISSIEETLNVNDNENWVYYSFSSEDIVVLDTVPEWDYNWDIAFRRYQIKTNSGISGSNSNMMLDNEVPKGFGVREYISQDFNSLRIAEEDGYVEDITLNPPMGGTPYSGSPIFENWYNYDPATHAISSKNNIYMIKTESGKYVKMKIDSYADVESGKELKFRFEKRISTVSE
ncbi:MAG: HmuY family protein [Candidatus Delongbacteria bacterium]|nr:HmuY family protein [Candidatus Delongbacteria bacterium]MBN2833483.1 HmuY family protein [Candidatus Delongbacteria bacterium]